MATDNLTSALKASGATQNGSVTDQLSSLATQLQQLNTFNAALTQQELAYASQSTSSNSGGGSVLDTIGTILGGGLGLTSLVSGLAGLFGGGSSAPPPVTPYIAPLPVQASAGFSNANGGTPFGVDSAQGNSPRAMTGGGSAPVTVQVQAMDSQSFLDHSQEIALAVRQAMLESTVLNDVIRSV